MSRKLISAQAPFKMLIANLRQGSDPSKGPSGNPEVIRQTYTVQHFPEIGGRGPEVGTPNPRTPGVGTHIGHVQYTTPGVPVASGGTILVAGSTFAGPTTLQLGDYTLTTDVDFSTAVVVQQATGVATVVATPSTATLTIGGLDLTDATGPRSSGSNDYDGTLGSPALIAADIVAAINDGLNGFTGIATAVDGGGGIINLTAVPIGDLGNAVDLATSDALDITVSGAFLTGGNDAVDALATTLGSAIDDLPGFSAVVVDDTITVTGPVGVMGNELAFYAGGSSPQNFTLTPADGTLTGAEPQIGPPVLT